MTSPITLRAHAIQLTCAFPIQEHFSFLRHYFIFSLSWRFSCSRSIIRCCYGSAIVRRTGRTRGVYQLYPPAHRGVSEVVLGLDVLKRLARVVEIDYLALEFLGESARVLGVSHGLPLSRKVPH